MFSGSPIEPPTTLEYRAPPSRVTRILRCVYELIAVSVAPPRSYCRFTSPSRNLSVYGSSIALKSCSGPGVTFGRFVVYGLPRTLNASWRFQPSAFTSWYTIRGVMRNRLLGASRTAALRPPRTLPLTFGLTVRSGRTASVHPPVRLLRDVPDRAAE